MAKDNGHVDLDENTRHAIQDIKQKIGILENQIGMLITGFMNAKGLDVKKYQFNRDFSQLEWLKNATRRTGNKTGE